MLLDKRKVIILRLLYTLYLLIPILLWSSFQPVNLYGVGQLLGLLSLAFVAIMPLLSGRISILERGVGQDKLLKWHSWNAKKALLFVIFHPIFLFGKYLQNQIGPLEIASYYHPVGFWLGYILLILLLTVTFTSIFTKRLKLDYEVWKKIHLLTYVIIIGGFVHSFLIGSHIQYESIFTLWWLVLLIISLIGIIHRNLFLRNKRIPYQIDRVVEEASQVVSIYLKPLGKPITHAPGQFAYTRFLSKEVPKEEHHFTISSAPGDGHLRFTIKALGDFTSLLPKLKKGDKVLVEGPYGAFSNVHMKGPFLFIAGGIGITPLMSMLSTMHNSKNNRQRSVLLYAVGGKNEIAFKTELAKMDKEDWLNVKIMTTRINEEDIIKVLTSLKETPKVFLVGPEPMMDSVEKMLIKLKIPGTSIYTEKFSLK